MTHQAKKTKFKMASYKEFLDRKIIYNAKKDPVWVYLEREMRENEEKKPYNKKVGQWLSFLKDLKWYYHCEAIAKYKRLQKELGPRWYHELSVDQRNVITNLPKMVREDIVRRDCHNVASSLRNLGVSIRFPHSLLMTALRECDEDAGVFLWKVYTAHFEVPPCQLLPKYNLDAKLLMSSLFFIDLKDLIPALEKLTAPKESAKQPKTIKKKKNLVPKTKYGLYLQKMDVPLRTLPDDSRVPPKPVFKYNIKKRSTENYEDILADLSFLDQRKKASKPASKSSECKQLQPPIGSTRNKDASKEYKMKVKQLSQRAKAISSGMTNTKYHIGTVTYSSNRPRFVVNNMTYLPTGYIPINGGEVDSKGKGYAMNILGYYKYPNNEQGKCQEECNCLKEWSKTVTDYMKKSKCKCRHFYDYGHDTEVQPHTQYFHPPTRNSDGWYLDTSKIFHIKNKHNQVEEFIRDMVEEALHSVDSSISVLATEPITCNRTENSIQITKLLKSFHLEKRVHQPQKEWNSKFKPTEKTRKGLLADLGDTLLITPHLPDAEHIPILKGWCMKRIQGKYISEKNNKRMICNSARRWLDLDHIDDKAIAYRIPFTESELDHMNWNHRKLIQNLYDELLQNFRKRNELKLIDKTQMFWATMNYHMQPNKTLRDTFFTYMPHRLNALKIINPYVAANIDSYRGRACPLGMVVDRLL